MGTRRQATHTGTSASRTPSEENGSKKKRKGLLENEGNGELNAVTINEEVPRSTDATSEERDAVLSSVDSYLPDLSSEYCMEEIAREKVTSQKLDCIIEEWKHYMEPKNRFPDQLGQVQTCSCSVCGVSELVAPPITRKKRYKSKEFNWSVAQLDSIEGKNLLAILEYHGTRNEIEYRSLHHSSNGKVT
jgi:hypothetical protein